MVRAESSGFTDVRRTEVVDLFSCTRGEVCRSFADRARERLVRARTQQASDRATYPDTNTHKDNEAPKAAPHAQQTAHVLHGLTRFSLILSLSLTFLLSRSLALSLSRSLALSLSCSHALSLSRSLALSLSHSLTLSLSHSLTRSSSLYFPYLAIGAAGVRDGSTARLHNEDDDANSRMSVPLRRQLCVSAGDTQAAGGTEWPARRRPTNVWVSSRDPESVSKWS